MERLPSELLVCIAKYTKKERLYALSQCSRRFYTVFQPLLYSHIEVTRFSVRHMPLIIRLWRHPKLASRVRSLELSWVPCEEEGSDEFDEQDEVVGFIDHTLNVIFEVEEAETKARWREHLHHSCEEAWMGLLLVPLNHLKTIQFGHWVSELVVDILNKAARRQRPFHQAHPFPYLQEVIGHCDMGSAWIDSHFLTPFFYFPAVRKIDANGICESKESQIEGIRHSSRPVREFTASTVYYCRGMLDWIAACRELEHIAIEAASHPDDGEIFEIFSAPEFRQVILPFHKTLRTLRMEFDCVYRQDMREDDNDDDDVPFGCLKEFAVLQNLCIRHAHLTRLPSIDPAMANDRKCLINILPKSLKVLEIKDIVEEDYPDLLSKLSELVRHRKTFTQLERLLLNVNEVDENSFHPLKLECEAAGITLKVEVQNFCRRLMGMPKVY